MGGLYGLDEGEEPFLYLLHRRVGEGVKHQGVELCIGKSLCEGGLEFAVSAHPESQHVQPGVPAKLHRIAHSRTGGRYRHREAGTVENHAVLGIGLAGNHTCTLVQAHFKAAEFAVHREVDKALVLGPVHIGDYVYGLVFLARPGDSGTGPKPVVTLAYVHVEAHYGQLVGGAARVHKAELRKQPDVPGIGLEVEGEPARAHDQILLVAHKGILGGVYPVIGVLRRQQLASEAGLVALIPFCLGR